jgi:hypothetical protein
VADWCVRFHTIGAPAIGTDGHLNARQRRGQPNSIVTHHFQIRLRSLFIGLKAFHRKHFTKCRLASTESDSLNDQG